MFLFILLSVTSGVLGMFPPVYHDDTFHELDIDGMPTSDFRAMALVDFDGDYYTDLVGTNANGTAVIVLNWRSDHFDAIFVPYAHPTETIVAIIAIDFARSGQTDFLISYRKNEIDLGTYTRILRHTGASEYDILTANATSAPATVVNYFPDPCGLPDVIAVYSGLYGVHQNVAPQTSSCSSTGGVIFDPVDTARFLKTVPPTASPTFTATVDMDGDMGADIVMPHSNGTLLEYHVYRAPGMTLSDRISMPLASVVQG